jgi:predicted ATPase
MKGGSDPRERPWRHVERRQTLLVLDNFEQVLEAAADVRRLLEVSARSKIVVTSRSPLHLRGEQELRVTPLPLADLRATTAMEDLSRSDAVALFLQRAAAVAPDLQLNDANVRQIAEICTRLDGLPLAIELAASRAGLLSPSAILSRMERRLPLLDGGPRDLPARQRTLRATVAWSYDLLTHRERLLFRRLSAMVGGSTLEAAEAVCLAEVSDDVDALECISALVDSSLVHAVRTVSEEPRFDMLKIIRTYGLERLEAEDDRAEIERRHASWFLRMAETAKPEFRGPEVERWLWKLEVEHDNLRAALRRAIEEQDSDVALRLVASLFRFWHLAGHISEGIRWARAALSLPGAGHRTSIRARALATLGGLAYWRNDFAVTRSAYEEALEISTELGDPSAVARASYNLAFAYRLNQDASGARELLDRARAMFELLDDRRGVADCLWALSLLARLEGDVEMARSLGEEGLRLHRELGDLFGLIDSLHVRARAAYEMNELDVARACVMESIEVLGSAGYRTGIALAFDNLAAQENERGRAVRAVRLGGASEALREEAGAQAPPEFVDLPDPREKARESLSREQIAAAWEEGRAMNLDAMLRYAREES